jgi:hypothetical protein
MTNYYDLGVIGGLKWWEKLILRFILEQKFETSEGEITTTFYYKIWKDKLYIVDIISSFTICHIILDKSK